MATDIENLAREVRQDWLRQRLPITAPDISEIPDTFRGRLPEDFVAFLTVAGLPNEDDEAIRSGSPDEWVEDESFGGKNDSLLIFADYLIDSHRYALWLSGERRGTVSIVCDRPLPPIGTFRGFLTGLPRGRPGSLRLIRPAQASSAHTRAAHPPLTPHGGAQPRDYSPVQPNRWRKSAKQSSQTQW